MMRREHSRWRSYKVPKNCHPLVRELFMEVNRQRIPIREIAKRAGLAEITVLQWRTVYSPTVRNLEACLNVLGRKLKVE